jgi:hypothetical protein
LGVDQCGPHSAAASHHFRGEGCDQPDRHRDAKTASIPGAISRAARLPPSSDAGATCSRMVALLVQRHRAARLMILRLGRGGGERRRIYREFDHELAAPCAIWISWRSGPTETEMV